MMIQESPRVRSRVSFEVAYRAFQRDLEAAKLRGRGDLQPHAHGWSLDVVGRKASGAVSTRRYRVNTFDSRIEVSRHTVIGTAHLETYVLDFKNREVLNYQRRSGYQTACA